MNSIKQQVDNLKSEINNHLAQIDIVKGKIKSIQKYRCNHANAKSFRSGDYSGATYIVFNCPDCGLNKEN